MRSCINGTLLIFKSKNWFAIVVPRTRENCDSGYSHGHSAKVHLCTVVPLDSYSIRHNLKICLCWNTYVLSCEMCNDSCT